jgi:hypothetical protein
MKHIELSFDLLTIKRLALKTCCKLASQVDRHLFSALGPSQGHKSGRLRKIVFFNQPGLPV